MITLFLWISGILFYITCSVVTYKVIDGVLDHGVEELDADEILGVILGCALWPLTVILLLILYICYQVYRYLSSFAISFSERIIKSLKK